MLSDTPNATPGTPPRGREEVKIALRDAAAVLFAERGAAAVSVREIAARAGVNHGLVHRHFGSKEALLREVLAEQVAEIADRLSTRSAESGGGGFEGFQRVADQSAYWQILARALLDGSAPEELQASFPVIEQRLGQSPDEERRLDVAIESALALGWLVFERYVVHATGLEGERDEIRGRMLRRASERLGWLDAKA